MAGLYPDDQIISVFGNEVTWPGLDPISHKFTNGDFTNPLIKPSFIPAETINLIIDNMQTFISGLGLAPNNTDTDQLLKALQNKYATTAWIKNYFLPVGVFYHQLPDANTPAENGWEDEEEDWDIWNDRAVLYGLSATPPPVPVNYYTLVGSSIGAGQTPIVLYNKSGSDFTLYQFKAQASAYVVPNELDPVMWTYLSPMIIKERRACNNLLTEDDLNIGDLIISGPNAGMYVWEKAVLGGKFLSIDGGFRPTFVSGGVHSDKNRQLTGLFRSFMRGDSPIKTNGVFYDTDLVASIASVGSGSTWAPGNINFDNSRAVQIGPEGSPRTLSVQIWRRVS